MNLMDVYSKLKTDEQCFDFLMKVRWPDGVRCPQCGCDKISTVKRKNPGKNKRTGLYTCLEASCKQQFSVTSGTLFHDSHLPLHKWFLAIALIVDAKKGISAKQIQRHLGVNYRTAWYLAHRIRKSMEEDGGSFLKGTVEVDETYIGGKYDRRRKRGPWEKTPVVGLVERGGNVRAMKVRTASKQVLVGVVKENVEPDSRLLTDENAGYKTLGAVYRHQTVNHSALEFVRGDVHTNSIEGYWSLLKRGIVGSFHQLSIKHLDRYLAEFSYRFNRRDHADLFSLTVGRMANAPAMRYQQLIAK